MRQHPRDILGVDKHTSTIDIRKRYHALMKQYHPDKLVRITDEIARKKAEEKCVLIQWAYELMNNPTKLKAFEDLHAGQSHFDPAFAIEYLRYDADGNVIGNVPRHSDRYRKLYDEYLEEFQIGIPNHSPAPNQLIEQLNSTDEKDIYKLIKDKEAQDSSDTHVGSKPLEINSNYLSILNGIQHFFQLHFDRTTLDKLRTDIQKVLEGELDSQVRELTLAFAAIINADSIQPNVHYPALNQLYNFMYRSIDSANEQVINIIANTQFQHFVKQVQKRYLTSQQPKHLTKEWLSTFDSEKPKHLLESNMKTQTYSHIEKEYADSFKDNHESTASEKIVEAACKQVDIAEVKFENITPDNNIDEDDDITENTNTTRNHQPRIKPILPKPKIKRSGTSARIGKANHYLLSAIAFQTNARFESESAKIAAGEAVALNLYRSAFMEVRKASSITRLYIFYQILSGVLAFNYQGDGVETFIKTVYDEFDLVSQFMPFVSMPLSHNDLHKLTEMDEKWLYNVLNHVSLSTQFDIQERTRAAYLLFEGVYTGLFPADKFDELRLRSMDTYLQSKGLSLAHMTEHLHPANSVLKRSPKGFVDPTAELNIPDIDGGRIIADIHGFKIDTKTGELSFQLTYWDENMPRSLRLMTESEFYHMLQYKIDHLDKAWFTLDPPDALFQHLPLQEAISSLPDIPLRQTLLDVDYAALKFFTTTGVSGVHPFDHEDTVEMIAHLPTHLIEVLMTKQSNTAGYFYNSTDPSRYWYKVGAVEQYYNTENGEVLCQIGRTPLIMSHQKMVIDQSGNMVDDHQPDELDLIINKALQSPQQVNELISHAVDPREKAELQDLASDLADADILFKESRKALMVLKATINQDDSIEKADKEKAFASQSAKIINRIHDNAKELADIRLQLQQQLKLALDLNKVFAKRFTEHMNELAQHIPIINRLRLFIKLNVIKNTFSQVRTEHAGNSLILKQLDILQVNQVEVAKEDSDKKVYVPAAIKRDIEGGLISFGGVSCEYLLTMLEQRIDSKIAQHDVLKTLNNRFSFGQPTANDIKNAQYQLGLSSYKMSTEDYIQAQSQISSAQLTLDLKKSHSSWMEEISNLHQFKPSFDPVSTLCSDSIQTSSFDFFPKNNLFPLDPLTSNFSPAPDLFAQKSSLSATAVDASAVPTPTQPLLQSAPPAFHPAQQPAAPQPAAPQPNPPPSFFFPPYFESDPYARKRPDVFINDVSRWQAAIPAYFAAGKTLSELNPSDIQDRFEELRQQASYLIDESQRVVAPIVNKFINAVEETLEPISSFMMELPLKDFAATVIGASHMPESHPSLATPDHQLTKELIRQCPAIYDFSQEQLKKYDANTATIVAPGVFSVTAEAFRSGFSVLSQASTLNALGIPPCPPEHHPKSDKENTINLSSLLHTIQNPEDLKILPENLQDQLTYVINEKGELTLHPCLSHSDKPFCAPNTDVFYLNPVDQQISRITAMGSINLSYTNEQAHISTVNILDNFQNNPSITDIVTTAFKKNGFGDISNYFQEGNQPNILSSHGEITNHINPIFGRTYQNLFDDTTQGVRVLQGEANTPIEIWDSYDDKIQFNEPYDKSTLTQVNRVLYYPFSSKYLDQSPLTTSYLYRGDIRAPSEIFKHGFTAAGNNFDLFEHAQGNKYSAYVPTSSSRKVATGFPHYPKVPQTFVYKINWQTNSINLYNELLTKSANIPAIIHPHDLKTFKGEQEFAIPKTIKPQDIKGAWLVDINAPEGSKYMTAHQIEEEFIDSDFIRQRRKQPFFSNPNYHGPDYYQQLFVKNAKRFGYASLALGAALDGLSLWEQVQLSRESDDYVNTNQELSRIAGGWGASFAAARVGGTIGARSCISFVPPWGALGCGTLGSVIGGTVGYIYGSDKAVDIFNRQDQDPNEPVNSKDNLRDILKQGNEIGFTNLFDSSSRADFIIDKFLTNARLINRWIQDLPNVPSGIWEGMKSAAEGIINLPQSTLDLTLDCSAILYNITSRDPFSTEAFLQPYLTPEQSFIHGPEASKMLYDDALERMSQRGDALIDTLQKLSCGLPSEQAKIITEFAAPGYGLNALKSISNFNKFGTFRSTPIFHSERHSHLSLREIDASEAIGKYVDAISEFAPFRSPGAPADIPIMTRAPFTIPDYKGIAIGIYNSTEPDEKTITIYEPMSYSETSIYNPYDTNYYNSSPYSNQNKSRNLMDLESSLTGALAEIPGIFSEFVSHSTHSDLDINSILKRGITPISSDCNLYGPHPTFYLGESGYSYAEIYANHKMVLFELNPTSHILDMRYSKNTPLNNYTRLTKSAYQVGYDAIKYYGGTIKPNGDQSYNLAFINNYNENLRPIGVYPVSARHWNNEYGDCQQRNAVSPNTIRMFKVLGLLGVGISLYESGNAIIESDNPLKESLHQASLLVAGAYGGLAGGIAALGPCGELGAMAPYIAPYTVPACIFTASIGAGALASAGTDLSWKTIEDLFQDSKQSVDDYDTRWVLH